MPGIEQRLRARQIDNHFDLALPGSQSARRDRALARRSRRPRQVPRESPRQRDRQRRHRQNADAKRLRREMRRSGQMLDLVVDGKQAARMIDNGVARGVSG